VNTSETESAARWMRYWILKMTTRAESGHVTSSLSAVDILAAIMDSGFIYDVENPHNQNNDRLIFSKGHATPLYYSFWALTSGIEPEQLLEYRQFGSILEGHPTPQFIHTIAATGSLGMGLGIGTGVALGFKKLKSTGKVWVLLGDGELAEGSVWESAAFASQNNLNNLIAIVDINRLGQSGETAYGWNDSVYKQRFEAWGWKTIIVDGHNIKDIKRGLHEASQISNTPIVILAKTIKGRGVSFLENIEGWHGKALNEEECKRALAELGDIKHNLQIKLTAPKTTMHINRKVAPEILSSSTSLFEDPKTNNYVDSCFRRNDGQKNGDNSNIKEHIPNPLQPTTHNPQPDISPREAIGHQLAIAAEDDDRLLIIDGDVKNSTHSEIVSQKTPEQLIECYIAEQQMVELAIGLDKIGFAPVVDTFAAFLTRAHDQIRMAAISKSNIIFIGTHVGISIGKDGPSQMGLEDIAMFRPLVDSTIVSPADTHSAIQLTTQLIGCRGIRYIRALREVTPCIYNQKDQIEVGKWHVLKNTSKSQVAILATGISVHSALKAHDKLLSDNIPTMIVDCYSIKPLDKDKLIEIATKFRHIIIVEDHYYQGGLGDSILEALSELNIVIPNVYKIAVQNIPRSGTPKDLMQNEGIDEKGIIKKVKMIVK
jgi:transketolase